MHKPPCEPIRHPVVLRRKKYEQIILEMLNRIITLEVEVQQLKRRFRKVQK